MKKNWIAGGLLSLAAGTLIGAETLSLTFENPRKLTFGAKTIDVRAGNAEGFLVCGKQGLTIPAETLTGEQGTLLFEFKQEKPVEKDRVNRYVMTFRCKSRMRAGLYFTYGAKNFRFHFGDLSGDVFHTVNPPFEYGKTYYAGIVWNGSRVQFFMDGKLIGDYKQPKKMDAPMAVNLGPYKDGWTAPEPWGDDTLFKTLKVFNHALTPAEVAKVCGASLKTASQSYPGIMSVPLNPEKAPALDGNLQEPFWKYAASLPVLTTLGKPLETFRAPPGKFLISADDRNLYLGFSYAIPAGNKVNAGALRTKDSEPEVWGSESFELYLKIDGNLYRFAGNAAGGYTEWKNNGAEWTAPWEYKSQLRMLIDNSSVWQGEVAIPWSSLGLKGRPDKPVLFNVCRTWCLTDYAAASSLASDGSYTRPELYPSLVFEKEAPALQVESQTNPSRGVFQQKVNVFSPTARKLVYEVALLNRDGSSEPFVLTSKELPLKKGETLETALDAKITTGVYDAILYTLKEKDRVYARCMAPFKLNEVYLDVRPRFIAGYLEFEIQSALLLGKFGADCDPSLVLVAPDGKEIARSKITGDSLRIPFDRKNPAGDYTAKIVDRAGKTLSSLTVHFPGIGEWASAEFRKDIVLPPFTPLKVKGSVYDMWGRSYVYDNSFFPTQIISQDVPLLAAPCAVMVNGRAISRGRLTPGSSDNVRAEFKTSASDSDCRITADSWVEYDGVSYSRFSLRAEKNIADLKLRFTLPASAAKYLHTSAGGAWGVKLTRPVPDGRFEFAFFPMVWLGTEDKGICFFTETNKNWTGPRNSICSIVKNGKEAVFEVKLREQLKAGETFDFEFGYVATPVKPLPADYPFNMVGDSHTQLMRRPGHAPVNAVSIVSVPYPHEIDGYFGDLPNEKDSPAVPAMTKALKIRDAAGNKAAIYMDARYLSDEYPEMAAFKDEWKASPERTLDYTRDGKKYYLYDCCPDTGASAFFHLHQKRCLERFKADGIYYDFGRIGACGNPLHGCSERWPILGQREFFRRTALVQYLLGNKQPIVVLHNTDDVQVPAITFATHLFNGEHIRQDSSTIMHNGKDILDTYGIEMFASELSSMPFGLTNSVYQANDVLSPKYGGGKEEPELYKFRITQAFLAGTLPHNTILSQSRCHYGLLEKIVRTYEKFKVRQAKFIGYWDSPATVRGASDIYVSVYARPAEKKALAVISHIGKSHADQTFEVKFDAGKLGFVPKKAVDLLTAPDPEYDELAVIRSKNRVPDHRAPLKLGDFGSKLDGIRDGVLKMSLKYHTFALVELSE